MRRKNKNKKRRGRRRKKIRKQGGKREETRKQEEEEEEDKKTRRKREKRKRKKKAKPSYLRPRAKAMLPTATCLVHMSRFLHHLRDVDDAGPSYCFAAERDHLFRDKCV